MKPAILVSACLLGIKCRYDGTDAEVEGLSELLKEYSLIPFCPETSGGLAIPRPPAEIRGGAGAEVLSGRAQVWNRNGQNLTAEFLRGARLTLALAGQHQPFMVVAKAKSPSCGVGLIYDGSFTGKLKKGDGVTTALLRQAGFKVFSEGDICTRPYLILGKNNG